MTVAVDDPETSGTEPAESVAELARWSARAGAFGLDAVTPVAVAYAVAATTFIFGAPWWAYAVLASLTVVVVGVNRWLLPTLTGWTWGRSVFGIRVQRSGGADVGVGRLALRDVVHVLDTAALMVGWLWPLWDARRRTFADILLHTEVHVVGVDGAAGTERRRAGVVLAVAAVLGLAGAGLGLQQYLAERAVIQARQQISEQGPRIVERVLSFGAGTYKDDFAKSQALVTDDFRGQLSALQRDALRNGPTSLELNAVSSAVLSSDRGRASMLVALLGQRGVDVTSMRFVSATAVADFVKAPDGSWRVDGMRLLKGAKNEGGQQIPVPPTQPGQSAPQAPPKAPTGGTR